MSIFLPILYPTTKKSQFSSTTNKYYAFNKKSPNFFIHTSKKQNQVVFVVLGGSGKGDGGVVWCWLYYDYIIFIRLQDPPAALK